MRKAFSMITAIFLIVIMATVALLVFNLSGKMVKSTTMQYRQEQAAFLARSYTELAILAVINHDRNATTPDCVQTINGVVNGLVPGGAVSGSSTGGSGYDVTSTVRYIGNNLPCSAANVLNSAMPLTQDYNTTSPEKSDSVAAIVVDVYVRYKDPAVGAAAPWITFHRRTLQKI